MKIVLGTPTNKLKVKVIDESYIHTHTHTHTNVLNLGHDKGNI